MIPTEPSAPGSEGIFVLVEGRIVAADEVAVAMMGVTDESSLLHCELQDLEAPQSLGNRDTYLGSGDDCPLSVGGKTRDTPIDVLCQEMSLAPGRIYRSRSNSIEMESGGADPEPDSGQSQGPESQLSIDDFGTDYSSLSRLRSIPVDAGEGGPSVRRQTGHRPAPFRARRRDCPPSQTLLALKRLPRA